MNRYAIRVLGGIGWTVLWLSIPAFIEAGFFAYDSLPSLDPLDVTLCIFGITWGWLWVFREALNIDLRRQVFVGLFLLAVSSLTAMCQIAISSVGYEDGSLFGECGTEHPIELAEIDRFFVYTWLPFWVYGIAMFIIAKRLSRLPRLVSSDRVIECIKCRYNLRGLREARCPECGAEYTLEQLLAK